MSGSPRSDILDVLAIERPIVQAPVGGCATPRLVAAVAEAGGIGTLACTWTAPAQLAPLIGCVRELTLRPFAANLVRWFDVQVSVPVLRQ